MLICIFFLKEPVHNSAFEELCKLTLKQTYNRLLHF